MSWNDHLPDPDRWEEYVEAVVDAADLARKRDREAGIRNPLVAAWEQEQRLLVAERGACERTHGCIQWNGHDGGCYVIAGRV